MTKFEEEFNYLIELSGKVLLGQVDAETFKKNRIAFFEKYETDQQQALPVVPEFVAEWIEILKTKGLKPLKNPETYGETGFTEETLQDIVFWIFEHQEDYMRAWLDGYTVEKPQLEKPQLFYLKHIDMSKSDAHLNWYLAKGTDNVLIHQGIKKGKSPKLKCILKLTQQEIDSMQTGSYELVPVEDGE
ncbi:DUF1642 domain-containing protein [Lactococcus cremoris]|uniref:DUF1642 domain-containing protein n=1 Tax=Lactococcus lactis subsp. cremoris TaxID=1359 RepID=UPI00300E669A